MGQISEPTWLEDTPTRCRVFFFHAGPIESHQHDLGFFVSPSGSWWIPSLKVSEGNRPLASGGDYVNIMAGTAMQHIVQPPGHANDFPFGNPVVFGGAGMPGAGGPAMNAAAHPRGGFMQNSADVVHAEGHVDRYTLGLTISVRGPNIRSYGISFTAEHLEVDKKEIALVEKLVRGGKGDRAGGREQQKVAGGTKGTKRQRQRD